MNEIGSRTHWESFLSFPDIQNLAAELELDLSVVETNSELLRSADLEVLFNSTYFFEGAIYTNILQACRRAEDEIENLSDALLSEQQKRTELEKIISRLQKRYMRYIKRSAFFRPIMSGKLVALLPQVGRTRKIICR